jgi:uncharacterized phage protein (TIGR01671 family)
MREYKFRGLNRPSGEWIYGYLVVDDKYCQILQHDDVPVIVDPDTVGQFTERHDKSDKKIYEGDIILCPEDPGEIDEPAVHRLVEWNKELAGFKLFTLPLTKERYGLNFNWLDKDEMEKIGNIHENPELLRGLND